MNANELTTVETAEELADVEEGAQIKISYKSGYVDGTDKTIEGEVVGVTSTTSQCGEFTWATATIQTDENDLPRRKVNAIPGDSFIVKGRRTTKNGAVWATLPKSTNVSVEVEEDDEIEAGDTVRVTDNRRNDDGDDYGAKIEVEVTEVTKDYTGKPILRYELNGSESIELVSQAALVEKGDDDDDVETDGGTLDVCCNRCGGETVHTGTTTVNHWINEASAYESENYECVDCGGTGSYSQGSACGVVAAPEPSGERGELVTDGGKTVDDERGLDRIEDANGFENAGVYEPDTPENDGQTLPLSTTYKERVHGETYDALERTMLRQDKLFRDSRRKEHDPKVIEHLKNKREYARREVRARKRNRARRDENKGGSL